MSVNDGASDVRQRGWTRREVVVGGSLGAAGLLALAQAGPATARDALQKLAGAKPRIVRVTLGSKVNEFTLVPSVRAVAAGPVTFVVHNGGKVHHEFVVLKTKIPARKLPMGPSGKQAKETGALGEIGEFAPGKTRRMTLKLKPGHHVLLCNVPGHYKSGQFADFRVT